MPLLYILSYTNGSKEVPACVRIFNALIFGTVSSACAKEYFIAANCCKVLMLAHWARSAASAPDSQTAVCPEEKRSINVKLKLQFAIE